VVAPNQGLGGLPRREEGGVIPTSDVPDWSRRDVVLNDEAYATIRTPRYGDLVGDNPGGASARLRPSSAEPLRGLDHLARVALLGRDRILEKAREPVSFVWKDIAVAGTIVLLAGGPSEGKTTLLFLLLCARASVGASVDLLGRSVAPAPQGQRLVLIEGEHGEGSTCRKLKKSCAVLGVDDLALDRIIVVARKAVRLGSPAWRDIEALVAAGLVSDIALDTVARVAPGEANDEREQVAIFDIVAQTIEAAPPRMAPTAWACAHTRKNATGGLADVSGSAQRAGQADSVLLVKGEKVNGRTVSSTVIFEKLREDPEDDYPKPVTFAIVSDGEGGRTIRINDAAPEDSVALESRIEGLLLTGPKTKRALRDALKRSDADMEKAISNLFAARRIMTTNVTIAGRPRKAFTRRPAGAATGAIRSVESAISPRDEAEGSDL
jgi:hypothetical protein